MSGIKPGLPPDTKLSGHVSIRSRTVKRDDGEYKIEINGGLKIPVYETDNYLYAGDNRLDLFFFTHKSIIGEKKGERLQALASETLLDTWLRYRGVDEHDNDRATKAYRRLLMSEVKVSEPERPKPRKIVEGAIVWPD
jgi:hypothetical protein